MLHSSGHNVIRSWNGEVCFRCGRDGKTIASERGHYLCDQARFPQASAEHLVAAENIVFDMVPIGHSEAEKMVKAFLAGVEVGKRS